ncbi:MAG: hypothetical protein LQ351_004244 [Letrouitia transgressa]|nr:MAG: hypothetical protein LQ351_004244 [Letrouitia transgressa]
MSALRHTPDPAVIPNTYRYDQLGLAARHLIDLWEQEPLYIGTKEHDRAKVRLVRDLLIQGKMDEAVERGILTVANHVREQAEIVTFVDENCEYVWHFPAPKVIKMKELRLEGFERTIDLKAQALVMEAEGRPQWRLDLEDRIKESQERNKTKQGRKEKNEKRNRRRMKLQKRRERRKAAKAEANKQSIKEEDEEIGGDIQLDSFATELEVVKTSAVNPLAGNKTFDAELPFRPH